MGILPLALVNFTSGTKTVHALHLLNGDSQGKKKKNRFIINGDVLKGFLPMLKN